MISLTKKTQTNKTTKINLPLYKTSLTPPNNKSLIYNKKSLTMKFAFNNNKPSWMKPNLKLTETKLYYKMPKTCVKTLITNITN